jgi:hypothetical protein
MPAETSSFYPPRAGPASRSLAAGGRWLRLVLRIRKRHTLNLGEVPPWRWLLVPGLLWRQLGKPELGTAVLAVWAFALILSILTLNPALASAAALTASGLHGLCAAAFLTEYFPHWPGIQRLWRIPLLACLWVMAFYGLGVRPAAGLFVQRLTARDRTVMIQPAGGLFAPEWRRGDWVAYQLPETFAGGHFGNLIAWQTPGADTHFDRILAVPGDTIQFHPDFFEVGGQHFEKVAPDMPSTGTLALPRDDQHYLIWPTNTRVQHGTMMPEIMLAAARIPENRLLGKPWSRWFWRKQLPPPLKIWQTPAA